MSPWKIPAVIIAATIALTVFATSSRHGPAAEPQSYADRAWADACRLSGYDCAGVKRPAVTVTVFSDYAGVIGVYYPGTKTVFVSPNADPGVDLQSYAVIVHEMTHYLQWTLFGWQGVDRFMACVAEEDAYRVSNALLREHGAPEVQLLDWATSRYNCGPPEAAQ